MQTTRDLTQALYVAAVALGRTRDAEEVVRVAIAETQRAAGIEAVSLYLLDCSQQILILREYAGTTQAFREQMASLPLSEAHVAATAIQQRRVASCAVDEHPAPALRALYQDQGFRHVSAVPVAGREEILGVLHLAGRQEPLLSEEEASLVQAIGGLVGVALENATLREAMTVQQVRPGSAGKRCPPFASHAGRNRPERRRLPHSHDHPGQWSGVRCCGRPCETG